MLAAMPGISHLDLQVTCTLFPNAISVRYPVGPGTSGQDQYTTGCSAILGKWSPFGSGAILDLTLGISVRKGPGAGQGRTAFHCPVPSVPQLGQQVRAKDQE